MRLIKKGVLPQSGKPDPESEHEGTCDYCEAEFIFRAEEASFYKAGFGDTNTLGVWCPTCNKAVYISIEK